MSTTHAHSMNAPVTGTSWQSIGAETFRRIAAGWVAFFTATRAETRETTRLYYLNDHVMRDIGLDRTRIGHGPTESFWRD